MVRTKNLLWCWAIFLLLSMNYSIVLADNGVAQLQFVTQFPIASIQVIGSNQDGAAIDRTWTFTAEENVTAFTTWGWWWRIIYFCDGPWCDYPEDVEPYVWIEYIDGYKENKRCISSENPGDPNFIGRLNNVHQCVFFYPGGSGTGSGGGTSSSGTSSSGTSSSGTSSSGTSSTGTSSSGTSSTGTSSGGTGSGTSSGGTPTPLPLEYVYVAAPSYIELGNRPYLEYGVRNPNGTAITVNSPVIRASFGSIPTQFDPFVSYVFFDPRAIDGGSLVKFSGAPESIRYDWINREWPILEMCDANLLDHFSEAIKEEVYSTLWEEAFSGIGKYAALKTGMESLQLLVQLGYWEFENILAVIDAGGDLHDIGQVADYLLLEGNFDFRLDLDQLQSQSTTITVGVPQANQSQLANGMNALIFTTTTMMGTDLVTNMIDVPGGKLEVPLWVTGLLIYTEGMGMTISCYPISTAYAIDYNGSVVYPNSSTPLSTNSVSSSSMTSIQADTPVTLSSITAQYREVQQAIVNLDLAIYAAVEGMGDSPNPGQFRRFQRDVAPAIEALRVELTSLQTMLPYDTMNIFEGFDILIPQFLSQLDTIESLLSSGDPRLVQCLLVSPSGSPITASGEIHGTDGNDIIIGSNQSDVIYGHLGNDCIIGDNGQDVIYGGDGDDILFGDNGVDNLYGEAGDDLIYGGNGGDILSGGSGTDILLGENGPDEFYDDGESTTVSDFNGTNDPICDNCDTVVQPTPTVPNEESSSSSTDTEAEAIVLPNCDSANASQIVVGGSDDPLSTSNCQFSTSAANVFIQPIGLASIGNQGVIDNGVITAVDVSGWIGSPIDICFYGQGGILFLDAASAPRTPVWMPTSTNNGMTCTTISTLGTVVLTQNNGYLASDVSDNALLASYRVLSNCRVTTTHMLNLRELPTSNADVITIIPYEYAMESIGRTDDWFHVIFGNNNGYVSADYLQLEGTCG
jgi:hypothetical protein